jgi:hypothetical protein
MSQDHYYEGLFVFQAAPSHSIAFQFSDSWRGQEREPRWERGEL